MFLDRRASTLISTYSLLLTAEFCNKGIDPKRRGRNRTGSHSINNIFYERRSSNNNLYSMLIIYLTLLSSGIYIVVDQEKIRTYVRSKDHEGIVIIIIGVIIAGLTVPRISTRHVSSSIFD